MLAFHIILEWSGYAKQSIKQNISVILMFCAYSVWDNFLFKYFDLTYAFLDNFAK